MHLFVMRLPRLRTRVLLLLAGVLLLSAGGCVFLWAGYHYRKARDCQRAYEFAAAYEHLRECLRVWRWSAPLRLEAGRAARRGNLLDEAEEEFRECRRLQNGMSPPLQMEWCLLRAQKGDMTDLESNLVQAVQADAPETDLILEALAQGYLKTLRYGAAKGVLDRLLQSQPDNVRALYWRGFVQENLSKPKEAAEDYRAALALDGEHEMARRRLAGLLLRQRPREALTHLQHLCAVHAEESGLLVNLAVCHKNLGENDEARRLLDRVLAADPNNPGALVERGILEIELGNPGGAESWLRHAIREDPSNHEAHYQLFLCLTQQTGRTADAEKQRRKMSQMDADLRRLFEIVRTEMDRRHRDPALLCEFAQIFLRIGEDQAALYWLYQALQVDENYQPAHKALVDYYESKGDKDKAAAHRSRLLRDKK
jgi:tetratricopeptide (TPR) repeat protein